MATFGHSLIWALACISTLMYGVTCKPVIKRSATDCYGTDCIIPQDELDFHGNPLDTELLENITGSVVHALPEITDHLKNIAYYTHQNITVNTLPSILQILEDEKDLQVTENLLIENVTAVFTPILSEMVKLMQDQLATQERHTQLLQNLERHTQLLQNQQVTQERLTQLLQNQQVTQERLTQLLQNQQETQERHTQLLQNQQETQASHTQLLQNQQITQERHNQLMEDQADRQSGRLENVTALLQQSILPMLTSISRENLPFNCSSGVTSGQNTILPPNTVLGSFPVVCDMDTDGGRWIVFQRRFDGSVDFDRIWDDYERGFGSPDGEFWLGLEKLHVITSRGQWELRVDLYAFDGTQAHAIYDNFRIGDSASFYRLDIGSYSGTAGDSMRHVNGKSFTTKDQDHDQNSDNCAIFRRGAWWHKRCTNANLNGLYLGQTGGSCTDATGMFWYHWKECQSLKKSELKLRLTDG